MLLSSTRESQSTCLSSMFYDEVCPVGQQNRQDQGREFPQLLVLRTSKRFLLMKWQSYGFLVCETQLRERCP